MNLHEFTASNGLIVEYEQIVTNLRIKNASGEELFHCELIGAGLDLARITLGNNIMTRPIHNAVCEYMVHLGFVDRSHERLKNGEFISFRRAL